MNFDVFFGIVAGIGNILLGLFTYLKNPKSATNRLLFLFIASIVLYVLFNYLTLHQPTNEMTLFWVRKIMADAIIINILFFLFAYTFPSTSFHMNKKLFWISIISSSLLLSVTQTSFIYESVIVKNGNFNANPGPGIPLIILHTLIFLSAGFFVLVRKFRKSTGTEKNQIRILFLGAVFMFIAILITNFFLIIIFNITSFVGLLPVYTLVFFGSISYAIVRHKFLDIRLIIARTIAYLLVLTVLTVAYTIAVLVIGARILNIPFTTTQYIFLGIIIIISSFSFQSLRRTLESFTDKIFFKGYYDPQDFLRSISSVLASNIELKELTIGVLKKVISTMRITRGAFVLLKSKDHGKIEYVEGSGYKEAPDFSNEAVKDLLTRKNMIIFDELEEGQVKHAMRKLDIAAALPLMVENEKVGLLCLGEKSSGEIYSEQDIKVLEILKPELSVAVQNSREYEEIKRFNITLREEIEKATSDLRDANEKLKELDKLKDEFVSLASHELRTPMTVIKSYLWMVLQGKVDKGSDKEKDYLNRVYKSTEDLISLVNSMLNVSRIEAGKIIVMPSPTDIVKWTKEFVEDLAPRSQETGINISVKESTEPIPQVMVDSAKIREVFTNIVGNSFKFTPNGGKVEISFNHNGPMVDINITDNGKGISKDDMPKLFQKFGQTGKDVLTRPLAQGTGLGLYITKAIVELHGGKIWASSEGEGKGTTFSFSVKVATPDDIEKSKHQTQEKEIPEPSATLQPSSI